MFPNLRAMQSARRDPSHSTTTVFHLTQGEASERPALGQSVALD